MSGLAPRPLSAAAFAAFGEVLTFDGGQARPVNDGRALRADLAVELSSSAGRPRLALFRVDGRQLPLAVAAFERHPNSSQMFFSLSAERFLLVMAPSTANGGPAVDQAEAFVGLRGQGVAYRPGVWHAPIVALGMDGDFLMLIWEEDAPDDCHVERLAVPVRVRSDHG